MLARMQGTLVNTFLKKPDHNLRRLVQDIAEHSGIRPLSTQGHLGDIVPGRLVYDAQTTEAQAAVPCSTLQARSLPSTPPT